MRDHIGVLFLCLLALGLRLPGLGSGLWFDEIVTLVSFVQQPLQQIVTSYDSANNHIFYSLLAHCSIALFGETAIALRLPALLFGVATVPIFFALARSITSRGEALAATLLLTLSYHHTYFCQNARGYTGYLFFSLLSTALLIRAFADDRPRYWVGFVFASVANLYIHLNGLFVLAAQVAGTLMLYVLPAVPHQRQKRWRRVWLSVGAVAILTGLLYAPVSASIFTFFSTEGHNFGWSLSLAFLQVVLRDVAPGVTGLTAVLFAIPVGLVGLVSLTRTAPLLAYVMFLPPLLLQGVASITGIGTYPRFFLILLPFGILFAVRGLRLVAEWSARELFRSPLLEHRLFALLVFLAALAAASGLPRLYTLPKQDYVGALAFVASRRAPGEVVAAAYIADRGARFYDPTVLSARTADDLEKIVARGMPVWLLGTFLADMAVREPRLAALIDAHFREVRRFPGLVGDGTVVVWKSVQPTPPLRRG